ncbi:MAG: HEAT repeat domain-containing protein [Planctomycetes bacterium]|nr:HEAT repeat domain-containing protein [Planctomycetota bacterium]
MNLRALILCAAACGAASSRGPAAGQELAPADPAAAFLAAGDPLARERARRVLIGREEGAAKVLCAALASADPHLCETALLTLAECPAPDLDPGLLAALEDGDRSLRIAALKALAARGAASLHPAVLAAARAEHWAERRAAALALARTRAEEAVPPLCALAADPDRDVSEAALRGLLVAQTDAACDALRASFDAADVERGERILVCLARRGSAQDAAFFEEVLDAPCDDRLRVLAAAALAARGARPLAGPRLALLLRCSASGDPRVGRPAAFALSRDPAAAGAALLEGLPGAAPQEAGAWADLAVGLLGPAARGPLLAVARGETPATDEARAAAVHALRRFRTAETANDLLWIYSPELPRALREELCGAFEDLPRHPAARSGLLQLLEDGEGNLRLRAFRVLLQYGASAPEEIAWLLERVLEEKVDWVRQRMCRLLATYARGDGARAFAERMIDALGAPEPFRSDARDALENLSQSALKRRAAQAVLARSGENLDFPTLRLLTRLEGEEADSAVARALQRALLQGDADLAVRLLVALRAGGGPGIAGALRLALESDAAPVRDEALRALLARGDEQALDTFARLYDRLDGAARAEFLGLVRCDDAERLALLFQDLLAREQDDLIAQAIVENAGQERAPIAGALVDLLRTPRTAEFTACAAEALASIGGAAAEEAVCGLFQEQLARTLASGMRAPDDRLLIESLARSAARTGRSEVASGLAALLFHRVAELEALQYDVDAAFPFEMTIMQALLDLALACGDAAHVAATVEVEMDRRARGGDLFLLPKALFARLVLPLEELEAARAARTHGARRPPRPGGAPGAARGQARVGGAHLARAPRHGRAGPRARRRPHRAGPAAHRPAARGRRALPAREARRARSPDRLRHPAAPARRPRAGAGARAARHGRRRRGAGALRRSARLRAVRRLAPAAGRRRAGRGRSRCGARARADGVCPRVCALGRRSAGAGGRRLCRVRRRRFLRARARRARRTQRLRPGAGQRVAPPRPRPRVPAPWPARRGARRGPGRAPPRPGRGRGRGRRSTPRSAAQRLKSRRAT